MSEHRLYSVAEIATLLGSTPKAVRAMVYRGALPAYRLGGETLLQMARHRESFKACWW